MASRKFYFRVCVCVSRTNRFLSKFNFRFIPGFTFSCASRFDRGTCERQKSRSRGILPRISMPSLERSPNSASSNFNNNQEQSRDMRVSQVIVIVSFIVSPRLHSNPCVRYRSTHARFARSIFTYAFFSRICRAIGSRRGKRTIWRSSFPSRVRQYLPLADTTSSPSMKRRHC